MIREAIILAGGMGTRLRSEVHHLPKCLAPVNQVPFLTYLIRYLLSQDIQHFIFSLGYKSEQVIAFLEKEFSTLSYSVIIEDKPLGTGGAIHQACKKAKDENVLVCNGDTLYKAKTDELENIHLQGSAECTIALKPMKNFDRYGSVSLDGNSIITAFHEKKFCREGLINGGMYLLHADSFLRESFGEVFSFEKDYLEKKANEGGRIYGCIQEGFFIDIGIPEDYHRASVESELKNIY